MKILTQLKKSVRKGVVLGAIAATVLGIGVSAAVAHAAGGVDCDANAVIYCGATSISSLQTKYNQSVSNATVKYSAASIHNIYSYSKFGISSTDVADLSHEPAGTKVVVGSVTKSGDVFVPGNSIPVATGAISAGRQNIAGSTQVTNNGTTFYVRPTSVSFVSNSLSAFVVMKNGVFQFAIIESCGNPVHATPKVSTYTFKKEVRTLTQTSFHDSVTVNPGTKVQYRITVQNTGNTTLKNVKVSDTLPAHISYNAGTLTRNGNTKLTAAQASAFFSSTGVTEASLDAKAAVVYSFEATVGPNDTVETCTNETLTNTGHVTVTSLPGSNDTATVNKVCLPKPVFACTKLTAVPVSRTEFTYTATASAQNGATISGYVFNFGDGASKTVTTSAVTTSTPHTYTTPGTYNATVSVLIKVAGATKTVTAPACATSVTVAQAPVAECTDLTLVQDTSNPRAVSATATFTAQNGATLTSSSFNWGDGTTTAGNASGSNQLTSNHTYASDGDKTVTATLVFNAPGENVPQSACSAHLTITTVLPTCDKLDISVNNDTKTVIVNGLSVTENNGTYEFATLNWGDNSDMILASDLTGQTHTYSGNGPFTITATAVFSVNGQDVQIGGAGCVKQVSFTETPTPPVTPPTTPTPPTKLVNTGAGNTIGLFATVTIAGMYFYRRILGRRLSHDS